MGGFRPVNPTRCESVITLSPTQNKKVRWQLAGPPSTTMTCHCFEKREPIGYSFRGFIGLPENREDDRLRQPGLHPATGRFWNT